MDATAALHETQGIVNLLMAGLAPEHRDMSTPCANWTVHELVEHMCDGGHRMASALAGEEVADEIPDLMVNGPSSGWSMASGSRTPPRASPPPSPRS